MKKNPLTGFVFIKNERWKLFLAMRLTIVFLFCFMLGGNATIMAQYRLNMKMGETTFEELFQEIRKQTGCIVMYNNDMLKQKRKGRCKFWKNRTGRTTRKNTFRQRPNLRNQSGICNFNEGPSEKGRTKKSYYNRNRER